MGKAVYIILKSTVNIVGELVKENVLKPMCGGETVMSYEIKDPFIMTGGLKVPLCNYYNLAPPEETYIVYADDIMKVYEGEYVDKIYNSILEDYSALKRKVESGLELPGGTLPPPPKKRTH